MRKSTDEAAAVRRTYKKRLRKEMVMRSDRIPNITCVSSPSTYKTFITQLFGPCDAYEDIAKKLDGIEMQCRALQVQGALGFGAIVATAKYGSFLIVSLPLGQRENAQFASRRVDKMVKAAFWGDATHVCRLAPDEIDRIVKDTKHMTKCHIPLLGLEQGATDLKEYVDLAQQICDEGADATQLRSKLPMLANLDDDLIEAMAKDGRIIPTLQNYFGLARVGELNQIEAGCPHETEVFDVNEKCGECLARCCPGSIDKPCECFEGGGCRARGCSGTTTVPCECGAAKCEGSRLRFRCFKCRVVLCSRCRSGAECRKLNREAEAEIMARMVRVRETGGGGAAMRTGTTVPTAQDEILAIVENLPDEDLFEPASPALMRLLKKVGVDRKAALRREAMDKELDRQLEEERAKLNGVLHCSAFRHPFEFDGVEAAEMKRDCEDQVRMLLKHTMEVRGMHLRRPSREEVLAQFPAFVDLYVELFGSKYSGKQAMDNLLNKCAKPMFEEFVREFDETFRMPNMAELEPRVHEHLKRLLHNDPSITLCRVCSKPVKSERGSLVCSKKCEAKHRETHQGMVCYVCCKACRRAEFYNEEEDVWLPTSLLDMSEQELDGQLLKPQHLEFIRETRRKRNPVMFCGDACERVWSSQPVCATCGELWDGSTRSKAASVNVSDIVLNIRQSDEDARSPRAFYAPKCQSCLRKGCRGEAAAERPFMLSIRPRRAIC